MVKKGKINIGLQIYTQGFAMTIKDEKQRFVVIIEKEVIEKFKTLAEKEKRSASNLAAKLINDYVKNKGK